MYTHTYICTHTNPPYIVHAMPVCMYVYLLTMGLATKAYIRKYNIS